MQDPVEIVEIDGIEQGRAHDADIVDQHRDRQGRGDACERGLGCRAVRQVEGDPVGLALGTEAAGRERGKLGRAHRLPARLMPR